MSGPDLTGKHVAITGGARGIGAATARALAGCGARISIGDLDADLAAGTAAAIAEAGGTAEALKLDVTDRDSFEAFLATAEAGLGPLDVLINNAGIMPTGAFLDESDAVTDRQIDINIRGVVLGSKLAGRRFVDRGAGQIVNIASMAGISAFPGVAVYCATKHAVVGLGSALRQELEPHGVVVTTVAPSFVNTELIAGMTPNWLTRKLGLIEPETVAAAIARAIDRRRAGVRVVPALGGNIVRTLMPLPENVRNALSNSLGLQAATSNFDPAVRAAYRARTETTPDQR
ncbi:SDR family NAD(P)-dependent oxidoreductase [Nocardia stercoris]|uniref:SDR family NAD(P)-dependent oxidoreductase n=1 Tax=Nocardia stercoris TaxID=2483361 RepID=A0A3M2L1D8_9NOCA|nr:SDR family NAD(P)-dependent oxidoreductase [Nocardia stercoris]RMI31381.1 SDR family NAD(P)-dependent oxidoreductase [Nocardia stercoris]